AGPGGGPQGPAAARPEIELAGVSPPACRLPPVGEREAIADLPPLHSQTRRLCPIWRARLRQRRECSAWRSLPALTQPGSPQTGHDQRARVSEKRCPFRSRLPERGDQRIL